MRQGGRRKRKPSRRRVQIARGKRQVGGLLAAAVLFYVAFALTSPERFGLAPTAPMTFVVVAVPCMIAIALAIAAYFSHRIVRQAYLLLNVIGLVLGIVWVGVEVLLKVEPRWVLMDVFGVMTAIGVCWVFWHSKAAGRFLEEQELVVKRD